MADDYLQVSNLTHKYGDSLTLENISFSLNQGDILSILGPSGCGKTTLLECIAGFQNPQEGKIILNNRLLQNIPPEKRNIGLAFQDPSLFPHLTVEKNINYGLFRESLQIKKMRVQQLLSIIKLEGFEKKYPHQLSGGEQKRISLMRAIAWNPELLLLDEPFSNIDIPIKLELMKIIKEIINDNKITSIFITHNHREAIFMGKRIAIINDKKIHQIGTAEELIEKPKTRFVAEFFGSANFLSGFFNQEKKKISTPLGELDLNQDRAFREKQLLQLYLPPRSIELQIDGTLETLKAKITQKNTWGNFTTYDVFIPSLNHSFKDIPYLHPLKLHQEINVSIDKSMITEVF